MSSSENDPKKAEEMSLAELLGSSEAASISNEETPAEDSDDDKSGLINLSQMAALLAAPTQTRSDEPARPSMDQAPGFQGGMPTSGSIPHATQQVPAASYPPPSAGMPATNDYADVAPPKKKSPVALFAIVAIAVIAGGVGAYVALSGGGNDKAAKLAQLEAELAKAESNVATADNAAAPAENAAAPAAESPAAPSEPAATAEAEQPADGDAGANDASAQNESDADEDYVIEEEEVDDGKGGKKRRKVKRYRRKAARASKSASAAPAAAAAVAESPKSSSKAAAPAPAPKTKSTASAKSGGKTSALDSLLSGGGGGGAASNDGGLPQKPSRGQVQKAMGSVARKAKGVCSKSGSGKVSVRIIVGSNGVVRDAIPLGAHSADSLGRCVATFARRTARLPAFKASTFTFTYPFNI